jgi:tetratricopeptide (TPR) repeat protein
MKKSLLTACVLFLLATTATQRAAAQADSCIINLKNGGTAYEQGEYDGAIHLLRSALETCSLDKNEKINGYKLLILSYLKTDNLEEADKMAGRIMKIDPYYKPDKLKDDPRLSALFDKYKPVPVFRMGISGGINVSNATVENSYSIVHPDGTTGLDQYNGQTGFQLGLTAEYKAYHDLWVAAGFGYRQSKYEHLLYEVENTTINYSEKLSYFDLPVSLKYYFLKGTFRPYLEGGFCFSFLSGAISTTTRDDQKDLVDRSALRNNFMGGWFGGAGVAYSLKGLDVFVEARYAVYPDNVNKDGTRYADPVNVFKYYYIDDDFRLNYLSVNAGVRYALVYRNQKVK